MLAREDDDFMLAVAHKHRQGHVLRWVLTDCAGSLRAPRIYPMSLGMSFVFYMLFVVYLRGPRGLHLLSCIFSEEAGLRVREAEFLN